MNAAVAVAHCPPLPADPPLSQVRSTSGILNARSAPFLTKRAGMAHAITLRSDTPSEHDQGCARSHSVDENDRSTSIAARGAAARAGRQVGQSDRPAARAATAWRGDKEMASVVRRQQHVVSRHAKRVGNGQCERASSRRKVGDQHADRERLASAQGLGKNAGTIVQVAPWAKMRSRVTAGMRSAPALALSTMDTALVERFSDSDRLRSV